MAINSLSASSHGLSGLVSGMDTQQMVESMLSGTQSKIDAAKQKQTQLTYKQTMYRDVAAKMKTFSLNFLSFSSPTGTNLTSSQFFRAMSATSTSSAFKATATPNAATGKTTVNYVRQLAQSLKLKANSKATGALAGKFDATKMNDIATNLADAKNNLKIKAGTAAAVEISLEDLAGKSEFQIEKILQDELAAAGSSVSVKFENGQFTFTEKDGKELTIEGSEDAMALVSLGRQSNLYNKDGKITTKLNGNNLLPSIDVTLNGVKKSVTFNPFTATSATALKDQLNVGLRNAFGANAYVEINGKGEIEFLTKDSSSVLTVVRPGQQANGLDVLGIASNSSTKISLNMTLGEANLNTKIAGSVQRFSIGGVDFSFSSDTTLGDVIAEINSSNAGVKVSYQDVEDKFVLESSVSGELALDPSADPNNPFNIKQTEGNLLSALFGTKSGSATTGNALTYNKDALGLTGFNAGDTFAMAGETVDIMYGSMKVTLKIPAKEDGTEYTMSELATELTKQAEKNSLVANVKFSVQTGADGKEYMKVVSDKGVNYKISSGLSSFGIADETEIGNKPVKSDTTLTAMGLDSSTLSIKIGGDLVDLTGVTTLGDLQAKLDAAVKAKAGPGAGVDFDDKGRYRIFGVDIPMTFEIGGDDGKLFGVPEFALSTGTTAMTEVQKGQNAIVSINGVEMERNSNEFSLNGISYELKEVNMKQAKDVDGNLLYVDADGNTTTDPATGGVANKIKGADNAETIIVSRDTEKVVEGLKKFVEDYNKLVNDINGLLDANAKDGYREYPPLTAKQKEGMSDKEVEVWEEKSKQGLLRGDNTLEGVMQNLRSAMYAKPDDGKLSLYNIGITTVSPLTGTPDNLVLDESKLTQMLAENPDEIIKLFTDSDQGFGRAMDTAIKAAINATPGSYGSIVQQAGAAGQNITDSFLYKELSGISSRLKSLEITYKSEYNRYWAQFSKMEQTIQQMNQQSSWLSQQFS